MFDKIKNYRFNEDTVLMFYGCIIFTNLLIIYLIYNSFYFS